MKYICPYTANAQTKPVIIMDNNPDNQIEINGNVQTPTVHIHRKIKEPATPANENITNLQNIFHVISLNKNIIKIVYVNKSN